MKRKGFLNVTLCSGLALIFLAIPFFSTSNAQANPEKTMVIDYADWLPQVAPTGKVHTEFLQGLERATGGTVKVKFHWAQSMGRARELYGMTVDGIADIANVVPAYTPGVFPMYSIFELPIHFPSAEVLSSAAVEMYKKGYFDKELSDIKVIGLFTLSPYIFQSIKYKITRIEDLRGLKIRASSPSLGMMVKAFGAVPVQTTASQMYTNLVKGVTDVDISPMDSLLVFKTYEICKYINEWRTFTTGFVVAMNKDEWKALPKDGKEYIEKNWVDYSRKCGAAYDAAHAKAKEIFLKQEGREITNFLPGERQKMDRALAPIWDGWIADMEAKGLPGRKAVKDLYEILATLGIEKAFIGYSPR